MSWLARVEKVVVAIVSSSAERSRERKESFFVRILDVTDGHERPINTDSLE